MQTTFTTEAKYKYTQNRELSWLRFNQRVLEEAADPTNPLLEQLKFIAIFSSNLDEFFMVRVGSLFDIAKISPEECDNKSGLTPAGQLARIYDAIPGLIALKQQLYAATTKELARHGVCELGYEELSAEEQRYTNQYFKDAILPIISPMIVGSHHPAPHLVNKCLYVAAYLNERKDKKALGFISIPDSLPSFLKLPDSDMHYIRTEQILLHFAPTLFGNCQVEEACIIAVTRNADLSFDDEKFEDTDEDFRNKVAKLLKKRDRRSCVRLEISSLVSEAFTNALAKLVKVDPHQIYFDSCPLNMKYVFQLPGYLSPVKSQRLTYSPYHPRWPEDLLPSTSMISQIQKQDRLLFFPFDTVDPFLKLLNEAAEHPDVLSIKITIYRLASSSKIAHTLCRAAENGKEVIVLMELRARFDEANNIEWSKHLEESGCQVIYGMEDYKCHSKICLITMRQKGKMQYITQIGTGNYNEKTNAMYTDLSIMTADPGIGEDGTAFFKNMLVNNLRGDYKRLLVAPYGIKSRLLQKIDEEIAKGPEGYICIKANAVTERDVIDKLREASQKGVEVQLIIRGICCILPGVPDHTEHIHVTSIVGRYLEHARIYCFGKGSQASLYIASADLMTRNLNRRVEIACPVTDPVLREQLLFILSCQLSDTAKASRMLPDGIYHRKGQPEPPSPNSHTRFMTETLHTPVSEVPAPPSLTKKVLHWLHRRQA